MDKIRPRSYGWIRSLSEKKLLISQESKPPENSTIVMYCKVQLFWEGYKNFKKVPQFPNFFWRYILSRLKKSWETFPSFVVFSEYLNFNSENHLFWIVHCVLLLTNIARKTLKQMIHICPQLREVAVFYCRHIKLELTWLRRLNCCSGPLSAKRASLS